MSLPVIVAALRDNGVKSFAAASLFGLTCSLAVFNVGGWLAEGLVILAILAACFEAIGFVFAVLAEDAARARRFDRALVCLLILAGSAAFNTVGGHRAWEASMADRLDADRQVAQRALDARRGELLSSAARARAEIERVPLPSVNAYTGRQDAARATWELATRDARGRQAAAEAALAELPVVAEIEPAFDERATWAFLGFLELAKALGLWAIGLSAGSGNARHARFWAAGAPVSSASEAGRRLVAMRRDRAPLAA